MNTYSTFHNFLFFDMEKELYRLATFPGWPENCAVRPPLLAKLGFFYTKSGDEVQCYMCGVRLASWKENEDPQERHKLRSPNCMFLNGNGDQNRPLKSPFLTSGTEVFDNTDIESDASSSGLKSVYQSAIKRAFSKKLFAINSGLIESNLSQDFDQLRREDIRFNTFCNWPTESRTDPRTLAREGLFYTGVEDRVQCAFCRGFMRNWKPTDIPSVEHKRHFPECPFVRGQDVGNVPVVDLSNRSDSGVINGGSDNNSLHREGTNLAPLRPQVGLPPSGVPSEHPKFPEFSDLGSRIRSFMHGRVSPGQTAERLASAGWFFVGPGDKVQCYQCGGNLRDWEPEDDPWEEHKKWYPNCIYVKYHQPVMPRQQRQELTPLTSAPVWNGRYQVEPREVKARMDTPTVRAILDLGYSRDLVRTAIEKQLRMSGDDFKSAESLLEEIFKLEESAGPSSNSVPEPVTAVPDSINAGITTGGTDQAHSLPDLGQGSSSSVAAAISGLSLVEEGNDTSTRSKAKRKRNKKKKQNTAASKPNDDEEQKNDPPSDEAAPVGAAAVNAEPRNDELMDDETLQYIEENRRLREERMCKVCMDVEVDTVFLPCGHLVCCNRCAPHLKNCPICRTYIRGTVKTFLS